MLAVVSAGCSPKHIEPTVSPPPSAPNPDAAPPASDRATVPPTVPTPAPRTLAAVLAADAEKWTATSDQREASRTGHRRNEAKLAEALRKNRAASLPPEVIGEVNLYRKTPTGSSFGTAVALSPDGTRLVVAESDLSAKDPKNWHRVLDLVSSAEICRFDVGTGGALGAGLVFSADGAVLGVGKPDNRISLFDSATGTLRNRANVGGPIWSLASLSDGSGWVASVAGNLVKLHPTTGEIVKKYGKEPFQASRTVVSPSASMIATYSKSLSFGKPNEECISVWETATGNRLVEFDRRRSGVPSGLLFSPDSRVLYSLENNELVAWDLSNGGSRVVLQAKQIYDPVLSADGTLFAYYSDPELVIHDLASGKDRRLRTKQFWPDSNPRFFPGGTLLATSSNSHFVVWDLTLARPAVGK